MGSESRGRYVPPIKVEDTASVDLTLENNVITADALTAGIPHDILSISHQDTLAATPTRGSLILANSTPKWAELTIGAANRFLKSDGTDALWSTIDISTDTNLTVTSPITLTDDDIGLDQGAIVEVGALNAGSITSGFGSIDIGSSTLDSGALTVSDGDILIQRRDNTAAQLMVDAATGKVAQITLEENGVINWVMRAIPGTDSDFVINRHIDDGDVGPGGFLDTPFTIDGATGNVTLLHDLSADNIIAGGVLQGQTLLITSIAQIQGDLLALGGGVDDDDISISFTGSSNAGSLVYEPDVDRFDFGVSDILHSGTFGTGAITATGLTIGNLVIGDGTIVDAGGIAFSNTDFTGVGNISGSDLDITGGTGDWSTTGDLSIGMGGTVLDVDSTLETVGIGTTANSATLLNIADSRTETESFFMLSGFGVITAGAADKSYAGLSYVLNLTAENDVLSARGVNSQLQVNQSISGVTTLTEGTGVRSFIKIPSGGHAAFDLTVTDLAYFRAADLDLGAAKVTVDTLYGLFLPDVDNAVVTTSWAIYSEGGDSSHVGNFKLGDNTAPTAQLHTTKGRVLGVNRYTTTQTLDADDHHVAGDTDGGAFTITLPAGVAGTNYRIANTGTSTNNLTIAPNGAELLLGVNSNFVLADGDALYITYETTEGWF